MCLLKSSQLDRIYSFFSNILAVMCSLAAALGCSWRTVFLSVGILSKTSWLLLFIGFRAFCCAESVYAVLELFFKVSSSRCFLLRQIMYDHRLYSLCVGVGCSTMVIKIAGSPNERKILHCALELYRSFSAALVYFLFLPIIKDHSISTELRSCIFFIPWPIFS